MLFAMVQNFAAAFGLMALAIIVAVLFARGHRLGAGERWSLALIAAGLLLWVSAMVMPKFAAEVGQFLFMAGVLVMCVAKYGPLVWRHAPIEHVAPLTRPAAEGVIEQPAHGQPPAPWRAPDRKVHHLRARH
jgi:hypothetical protein